MFFCFRALSTQQGGYVRATNLYYYYYIIIINSLQALRQRGKPRYVPPGASIHNFTKKYVPI